MTEKGKWIFLVDKLPTEVAPPAMSLHYAVPWPMENKREDKSFKKTCNKLRNLLQRCSLIDEQDLKETDDFDSIDNFPAPLGWYECPKEYGLIFKSEEELTPRYYKEEVV